MSKLRIALQKKGRLHDDSLKLLKSCGINTNNGKDQLKVVVDNFPLEILYLRNSDIPQYIADGTADIGIIGENTLAEKQQKLTITKRLGFSKCRLSLAVPKGTKVSGKPDYEGKKIATSYPVILQAYLDKHNIEAEIHTISGSVEIAPNIGLSDMVCDIVSSGSTLFKNGLTEREVIMQSEAVLVTGPSLNEQQNEILEKLLFRIDAVQNANQNQYVLLNVPNAQIEAVTRILPVLKSPTILPLAEAGWSSLHSVINENKIWDVIDALKLAGAEDILIVPINKMIR